MLIKNSCKLILLSVLGVFASFGFTQENQSHADINYHSKMYKTYQHVEFDLGGEPSRFAWREMPGLFPHTTIYHDKTRELGIELNPKIDKWPVKVNDKSLSFDDYVSMDDRIDNVMLVHQGKIVYQRFKTTGPLERHMTWSVSKVFTATALAKLEEMGKVDMQAPIKTYLPEFANTAWGDIVLQDVIDMTSGIDCRDSDGYQNTEGCIYRAEEALGVVAPVRKDLSTSVAVLKSMTAHRKPGEETEYTSSNTNISGLVVEAITQKPLARAIAELLWMPMGAEADGLMVINRYGEPYAAGGLSARLADIARFGLMFLDNNQGWGQVSTQHRNFLKNKHRPLFSESRLAELNSLFDGDVPLHSRWQWDLIWQDGDMFKSGYSGQGIYISPNHEWVMVWFGTADTEFKTHELLPIARKLSRSGLLQ
ncbi:MAG: serine hydrolase domain-containing protein [Paraglaciecola sp.]|uniref:serine hydrolase domain-containing protein n=1 Tax=Paraglaciecola sp. TaxID=1920173 RepID=UPI003297B16C